MPMPRMVMAILLNGRSVPVSIQGVMHRIRVGDDPISIPYEVYRGHAWKMDLVGESIEQVRTAMYEGEGVLTAPTDIPQAKPMEEGPLPEWDLKVPPEDYWNAYSKKKNPSKTIRRRLALAKRIMAKEKDGQAE